jgi:hypothetical protein
VGAHVFQAEEVAAAAEELQGLMARRLEAAIQLAYQPKGGEKFMAGQASKAIVKLPAAHLQRLIDLCGEDISMSVNSCTLPPPAAANSSQQILCISLIIMLLT